jgi:hypothetical protein
MVRKTASKLLASLSEKLLLRKPAADKSSMKT